MARDRTDFHIPPWILVEQGEKSVRTTLADLDGERLVILLGEPNSGKTTEFRHDEQRLLAQGRDAYFARLPLLVNEGGLSSMLECADARARWETAGVAGPLYLFCDGLDEGRLEGADVHKELAAAISKFTGKLRLHLRLSCRSRDWNSNVSAVLRNVLDVDAETISTLQPIDDDSVAQAAREYLGGDLASDFLDEVLRHGVQSLCVNAGLLRLMLQRFESERTVGANKSEIYRGAVERNLTEHNASHEQCSEHSPQQRREAAQKLAVCLLFGGYSAIGTVGRSELDGHRAVSDARLLKETLNTALFVGGNQFPHRSFAEYLAAEALSVQIETQAAWRRIKSLLLTPHGVPTPLRGLAGWLSQASGVVFDELMQCDPLALLEGDPGALSSAKQEALAALLAERFSGRDFQNEIREFPLFGQFVASETLLRLLSREQSVAVRSMAMEWVELARRTDGFPLLMGLALDGTEIPALRYRTADIVGRFGDSGQKEALKRLLTVSPEQDPEDELAGTVLSQLFPEQVTLEESLSALHFPRADSVLGSYRWFWLREFEPKVRDEELPRVLDRFAALVSAPGVRRYTYHELTELYWRLLGRFLASENAPDIERLYEWLRTFRDTSRELPRDGAEVAAIGRWLERHVAARRSLVARAIEAFVAKSREPFFVYGDLPFDVERMGVEDIDWLLADFATSDSEKAKLAYFDVAFSVWRWNDFRPSAWFEVFERIAGASPACAKRWGKELDPVEYLDHWQFTERSKNRERKIREAETRLQNREVLLAGLDKIQNDAGNHLTHCVKVILAARNEPEGETAILQPIAEKYDNREIDLAVADGLLRAWAVPHVGSFEDILPQRDQVSIPYALIKADLGLRLALARGTLRWEETTPEQRRVAILAALMRWLNALPDWFELLYRAAPEEVESHLLRVLAIETERLHAHPRFASQLARFAPLKREFAALAARFVESECWPGHPAVFSAVLEAAMGDGSPSWPERLEAAARERLASVGEGQQVDQRLAELIAAWWKLDWKGAWTFARRTLFDSFQSEREKEWFRTLFLCLPGGWFQQSWEGIAPEALAQVYADAARVVPSIRPRSDGWVTKETQILDLLDGLKRRLGESTAEIAEPWFREWLENPALEHDHDWMRDVLARYSRQRAERGWHPVSPEHVVSAVFANGYLVRSQQDLFELARGMVDTDLREVLRSDHSPLALLWEGTKTSGRRARNEGALQTLIYNQILLLFRGYHVVGAREPEVFDAKKPDFRLSVTLNDGEAIHLPVEIKKDDNAEIWQAAQLQLLRKYMRAESSNFGLLIVGWFCHSKRHDGVKYTRPAELEMALQNEIDTYLRSNGEGRKIAVIVVDCRMSGDE